jgi:hypothetical protein
MVLIDGWDLGKRIAITAKMMKADPVAATKNPRVVSGVRSRELRKERLLDIPSPP